jgi:uncharacterized protein with GYD domain
MRVLGSCTTESKKIYLNLPEIVFEVSKLLHFLVLVSYTQRAWEILVRSPQNRIELVSPVVEGLGGKVESGFLNLSNYEVVAIVQMPNNVNMAALSMAFMAQFAVKTVKTIPLITWEEGIEAMKKAKEAAYKPPETSPMLKRNE